MATMQVNDTEELLDDERRLNFNGPEDDEDLFDDDDLELGELEDLEGIDDFGEDGDDL